MSSDRGDGAERFAPIWDAIVTQGAASGVTQELVMSESPRQRQREILAEFAHQLTANEPLGPQGVAAEIEAALDALADHRQATDPRQAGGDTIDAGGPHDRGLVTYDSRNAVLVHQFVVSVAHPTSEGKRQDDVVALQVYGRINRPPDHPDSPPVPEQVEILQMARWDLAADLVANLHALASRDGTNARFNRQTKDAFAKLTAEGLTRRAP